MVLQQTSQKKKVLHVLNGLPYGGNENLCLQILHHAPDDVENILLNLNSQRLEMLHLFEEVPNLTIINQDYKRDRRLSFILDVARKLRKIKPQAVLSYAFGMHLFVGLAARLAGISRIAARAGNTPQREPSRLKIWKLILWFSRLLKIPIYSCSDTVHSSLQALTQLPQKSHSISNGCDVKAIATRAQTSRQKRAADSPTVIGMVARLNTIKDHQTLIRSFSLVQPQFPDTQLWLVGDGEQKQTLQNLVEELNLSDRVVFWGDRSDVPELLGQMDIYAFSTTEEEGFGIALIEAMAAKLPIVATQASACCEVLGRGEGGILVPGKDAEALAQAFTSLLTTKKTRIEWGNKAYQYALANHDIQQCADKWYSVLLSN